MASLAAASRRKLACRGATCTSTSTRRSAWADTGFYISAVNRAFNLQLADGLQSSSSSGNIRGVDTRTGHPVEALEADTRRAVVSSQVAASDVLSEYRCTQTDRRQVLPATRTPRPPGESCSDESQLLTEWFMSNPSVTRGGCSKCRKEGNSFAGAEIRPPWRPPPSLFAVRDDLDRQVPRFSVWQSLLVSDTLLAGRSAGSSAEPSAWRKEAHDFSTRSGRRYYWSASIAVEDWVAGGGIVTTSHASHQTWEEDTGGKNGHHSHSGDMPPLYDTHVPLSSWKKAMVAAGSLVGALVNPARADLVAAAAETTGKLAYRNMLRRMKEHPDGQLLLRDRPRVMSATTSHAWNLPSNTFGHAYAQFMDSRKFVADDRPPVRFVDDDELAYVATRVREVHDFWHVLFGLPTSVPGEIALKVVEFVQTGLPMCALALFASITRPASQRRVLGEVYIPWGIRAGLRCADLICIPYEKHFHEDLQELRRRWRIQPVPILVKAAIGTENKNK